MIQIRLSGSFNHQIEEEKNGTSNKNYPTH